MPKIGARLYELSMATLGEAALELLRLAVEHEQRHQPADEPRSTASDRKNRRAIQEVSGADAILRDVVNLVLRHRDHRQELVRQVRTAQALGELVDLAKEHTATWKAAQVERERQGLPRRSPDGDASFRNELAGLVRAHFKFWALELPEELVPKIVEALLSRRKADVGPWRRVAEVVSSKLTTIGPDSLEKISAALGEHEQRAGRFKTPEHAVRAFDDDPVGGTEILEYVVHLLVARGHPVQVEHAVMRAWNDAILATRDDTASPPSGDDPTASS
ncbi:hypothetical protein [Polyangium mundeleinium]|uniref:Uncharacterized protein n=1 Tax=Polyangium mundeleinium TaxID=2995306 RepID=A0ABT5F760_9BACT|nr:hypothetical protein [Polyangium mundeleinium]MDC0749948.1 hypothetical protein [Polyangium mundeleinium]